MEGVLFEKTPAGLGPSEGTKGGCGGDRGAVGEKNKKIFEKGAKTLDNSEGIWYNMKAHWGVAKR